MAAVLKGLGAALKEAASLKGSSLREERVSLKGSLEMTKKRRFRSEIPLRERRISLKGKRVIEAPNALFP